MKININAELRNGRSGVEARSPDLHLTSHGVDEQESIESLRRGVLAWCVSLQSIGVLEKALKRRRIVWHTDSDSVTVEVKGVWSDECVSDERKV